MKTKIFSSLATRVLIDDPTNARNTGNNKIRIFYTSRAGVACSATDPQPPALGARSPRHPPKRTEHRNEFQDGIRSRTHRHANQGPRCEKHLETRTTEQEPLQEPPRGDGTRSYARHANRGDTKSARKSTDGNGRKDMFFQLGLSL